MTEKETRLRIRVLQFAFGAGFALILAQAARVQLVDGAEHEEAARAGRLRTVELPALRGGIFDRDGSPLALTEEVYRVDATIAEFTDTTEAVTALVTHLGLSERAVRREVRNRYAYFHGPFTSEQVKPLRQVTGVHLKTEPRRFRPSAAVAAAVLGTPPSDTIPARGLEGVFDSLLAGAPGEAVAITDQFGREYLSPGRLNAFPVAGHDVYLTIDADIQDLVEQALGEAIDEYDAAGGDVVIMRVQSGEILAMASQGANGQMSAGAFVRPFEPGSTAKLFAAAALLAHNKVSATDSVFGEHGEWTIGSRTIHDEHEEGWMRLPDVIRRSSNIGIAKLVARLDPVEQYTIVRRFGLGTPTGLEVASEAGGMLPRPGQWSTTTAASLAMGYEVSVTMVQLAQAYAAIGNDGLMVRPTLLSRVYGPDGREVYRQQPEPVRQVVSADIAAELRSMLRGVVDSGGTAEPALMSIEMGGKTGTARRTVQGRYQPGAYSASFVVLVPADQPEFVMAVKLEDPDAVYSVATAVPFARRMLEQLRAGDNSAIERERFGTLSDAPTPRPPTGLGSVPFVAEWPSFRPPEPEAPRPAPDVVGMSVREAAHALHEAGFRMRLEGWGIVDRMSPVSGTDLEPGVTVTVYGSQNQTR